MSRKSCNGSLIELVNAKKRLVPVLKINRPPYTVDPLHEGGGGAGLTRDSQSEQGKSHILASELVEV